MKVPSSRNGDTSFPRIGATNRLIGQDSIFLEANLVSLFDGLLLNDTDPHNTIYYC